MVVGADDVMEGVERPAREKGYRAVGFLLAAPLNPWWFDFVTLTAVGERGVEEGVGQVTCGA